MASRASLTTASQSPILGTSQTDEISHDTALSRSPNTDSPSLDATQRMPSRQPRLKRTQQSSKRGASAAPRGLLTPPSSNEYSSDVGRSFDSGEFPKLTASDTKESDDSDKATSSKGQWANRAEMILTILAYVGGFGDVWNFPFLALKHGQGTFIILFLLLHVMLGFPLVYLEFLLGQFSSMGTISVFTNLAPVCQGIGWAAIFVLCMRSIYYNVIMAWSAFFLVTTALPWKNCNNSFNTECCLSKPNNGSRPLNCSSENTLDHFAASELLFGCMYNYNKENVVGLGQPQWHLSLCLLFCWGLTLACVIRGVFGIVVYFSSTLPLLVLLVLCIFSASLRGAHSAVTFFIQLNHTAFLDPTVWSHVGIHVLFSVSPAVGVWTNLGSYNAFYNNCYRDAAFAVVANAVVSILSGFTLSGFLGFTAHQFNVPFDRLIGNSSQQLAFVIVPQALLQLSFGTVVSVLFFLMLLTIGLNTQFIAIDVIVAAICDRWPRIAKRRWIVAAVLCAALFLLGLPICTEHGLLIFNMLVDYVNCPVIYVAFLQIICVSYIYGWRRICDFSRLMIKQSEWCIFAWAGSSGPLIQWKWFVVCPMLLFLLIILHGMSYNHNLTKPSWWLDIGGNVIFFTPLIIICLMASRRILIRLWRRRRLVVLFKPTDQWCPAHVRPHKRRDTRKKLPKSARLDLALTGDRKKP